MEYFLGTSIFIETRKQLENGCSSQIGLLQIWFIALLKTKSMRELLGNPFFLLKWLSRHFL